MTTLREAALRVLAEHDAGFHGLPLTEALEALRAALAEPVQEPEPAGWFEGPFGEFRANPLHRIAWPAQTVAWSIPLYLAPPQRKPLTNKEIMDLCASKWASHPVEVARLIEQAHGIGGQDSGIPSS